MSKKLIYLLFGLVVPILFLILSGCGIIAGQDTPTIDMILIPAGEFFMGGDAEEAFGFCEEHREPFNFSECKLSWFESRAPIHTVTLDDYYIDKFEVTNGDYQVCVDEGVCSPPEKTSSLTREEYFGNPEFADYPVVWINWNKATTYCEWRGARLPSEAEWAKAARGTDGWLFPWGNEYAVLLSNTCGLEGEHVEGLSDTTPVGSYPDGASPYGVMDMAGNAFEWVADWYGRDYYQESPDKNPLGPPSGSRRAMRGSNYKCSYAHALQLTARWGDFPHMAYPAYGFRCASSSAPDQ
jgi:formylglycine-generating enzyme required for sulfatase activity